MKAVRIHQHTGLYPLPPPQVLGLEGAGIVEGGSGVKEFNEFNVGARVDASHPRSAPDQGKGAAGSGTLKSRSGWSYRLKPDRTKDLRLSDFALKPRGARDEQEQVT